MLEIPEAPLPSNAPITLTWLHNITNPNLDEDENHESKVLGGGAIAGIVIGSLAAAFLMMAIAWMVRRANLGPLATATAGCQALISLLWDRR